MSDVFNVVATSMQDDLGRLNAVAHNLANVSTSGFKRVLPNEASRFETAWQQQADGISGTGGMMIDTRQGPLSYTGSYLDLAIEGPAYFELMAPNGQTVLSRGGVFERDARGRLVAVQSGWPLLADGGEVFAPPGAFQIDADGQIRQENRLLGRLKLAYPSTDARISAQGEGVYQLVSGGFEPEGHARIRQGFQEASNVNSAKEMVTLIETTRHFESMQKVVHGVDAMWEKTLRSLGEF